MEVVTGPSGHCISSLGVALGFCVRESLGCVFRRCCPLLGQLKGGTGGNLVNIVTTGQFLGGLGCSGRNIPPLGWEFVGNSIAVFTYPYTQT